MSYKVYYTKDFNGCLRALQTATRMVALRKVWAAMAEASTTGAIGDLTRTHHGESRLDVEKYDLGGGYRLIVQLVDGQQKARAFLFAGTHDDADRWLERHRTYRWVESTRDRTLQFVQVTEPAVSNAATADRLDLSSSPSLLDLPLLRTVTEEDFQALPLPSAVKEYLRTVTATDYERDANGILEHVTALGSYEDSALAIDLLHHAHERELDQLAQRVRLALGEARTPTSSELVLMMAAPENAETIITFDDDLAIAELLDRGSLADWMLFLHPEQKRVAYRDFNGPVRLRGVSGSGKTSVLVHRARYLARKYGLPVLVVTLTESMRKLLDALIRELCGVELALIDVMTVSQLSKQIIEHLHKTGLRGFLLASPQQVGACLDLCHAHCRGLAAFKESLFATWERQTFAAFLRDEIGYVRGRLLPSDYETYLDGKAFRRRGRGVALTEVGRRICMEAIRKWDDTLQAQGLQDSEGLAALTVQLLRDPGHDFRRYRCVVADEVQDLSQIDMSVLSGLVAPRGEPLVTAENGIFLAGDGAQSIYKRGFVLRAAGIEVANRSFLLRKNYRNTFEILRAAYALIERYEFDDADEEDFATPSIPDYAKRRGERPRLVRCVTLEDEASCIAAQIGGLIAAHVLPGQICVIGPSPTTRMAVQRALTANGVGSTELREDVAFESQRVKISTIESAKGHEFAAVFVLSLNEGILPSGWAGQEELPREASRLYVAMTRARDSLWLTYNTSASRPSRFLLPVQPYADELSFERGTLRPLDSLSTTEPPSL